MSVNTTSTADPSKATDIRTLTISGIQNVSGLLPLLGTEQCEEHVTSTLDRGFLYAAGAPMSMFGSLGIIKAGFIAFWISIDKSPLHGPRLLKNAGFSSKGVLGKLAYAMDTNDSICVAENDIRSILQYYPSIEVRVNILCWRWIRWNLLLSFCTVLLGSLGLLSFVDIIKSDIARRPFSQNWMYPVLRVYGSVVVSIVIQLVIQLRILVVVHDRIRFHAMNIWFQRNGRLPPHTWNPESRAAESLSGTRHDILAGNRSKTANQPSVGVSSSDNASLNSNTVPDSAASLEEVYWKGLEETVGATWSFSSFDKDLLVTSKRTVLSKIINRVSVPTLLLGACRILLLGGICAAGIGYVGCFGLIQSKASNLNDTRGPGIWLAVEAALCVVRLAVWASNPLFDDPPPPIAIQKKEDRAKVTYEIGWTLGDVTVDSMHAVIIGINKTEFVGEVNELSFAESDAESVADFLKNSFAVPNHQVKLLLHASSRDIEDALQDLATDRNIGLGASIVIYLACHTKFSKAGEGEEDSLVFVTTDFTASRPESGLDYKRLLQLIQNISDNKGNNITVILDTCHAGRFGRHSEHDTTRSQTPPFPTRRPKPTEPVNENENQTQLADTSKEINHTSRKLSRAMPIRREMEKTTIKYLIGYPSHVLMAASSESQPALEMHRHPSDPKSQHEGGLFTGALLHHLGKMTSAQAKHTTYRTLIDDIRRDLENRNIQMQTPIVSGIYQNRLLFNGLLANKRTYDDASPEEGSIIFITAGSATAENDPDSPGKAEA
uniref:Peptidase C14 caspase domain-containing protein n=1 Tax=Psilocybe cubensis TaxID=181762 RepID=A0A8H8CK45_PSICU